MSFRFTVQRWSAWAPGLSDPAQWHSWLLQPHALSSDEIPALTQMPAMMRRRVEGLGRMALHCAYTTLGDMSDLPIVFASRFGDLARSVDLLRQLACHEPVSPAGFSLSVHNAFAALFSIARADPHNYTAIAAGEETVEAAFCEATGLLADGAAQVMVVYYDQPLPPVFASFGDAREIPRGWACRLTAAARGVSLSCEPAAEAVPASGLPADLRALKFLLSDQACHLHAAGARTWRWQRDA